MLVDQMHKRGLVEEREHAVEVFKIVLEQREGFGFWRKLPVHSSLEDVLENVGPPLNPLVIFYGSSRYHLLEGSVAGLVVDPLYAFWGENREAGR